MSYQAFRAFHEPHPDEETSLDTWKISGIDQAVTETNREYLFKETLHEFEQWKAAVTTAPISKTHARRIGDCGSHAWIMRSPSTDRVRVVSNTCKLRVCPRCRRIAAQRIATTLRGALASRPDNWRLVTLTFRSSSSPLKDQFRRLFAAFKRLRTTDLWKTTQRGGYAVLETTWSPQLKRWHPHLHVITAGTFIPQRELANAWRAITKGSYIVDVRPVRNAEKAVTYLTTYLAKPTKGLLLAEQAQLIEYYHAIHSQHFLIRFGKVPKHTTKPDAQDEPKDWMPMMPLHVFLQGLRDEHPWALRIERAIRDHRHPLYDTVFPDSSYLRPPPD